jgi:hypothetical protein
LSRTYESNGPEVKVRGNAQHIAEKYVQLARDAHAAGDPVLAESYLQHAEHYCRLLVAAHLQTNGGQNGREDTAPELDDFDELDGEPDRFTFIAPSSGRVPATEDAPVGVGPQPVYERGTSSEGGDYQPRERQPRYNSENNNSDYQPRERQPRYNSENGSGGYQGQNGQQGRYGHNNNGGRRDRYGRRERYQGGEGEGFPRDREQQPVGAPEGHENTQEVANYVAPQSQTTPVTSGDDGQRRDGRRDRFGRSRFGRPHRYNSSENAPEGEANEGRSRYNNNSQPRHDNRYDNRAQEGSFTPDSQRTESPRAEQQNALPAFLTQPTRSSAPAQDTPRQAPSESVMSADAPIKRGRGRPRKIAVEEGHEG